MKVYISKYRNHWYSPYTFLEKVVYRREIDYDDPVVEKWVERLNPISRLIEKVLDKIHPRIEYVKVDRWDTWNMDSTLKPIILPMLKQLKETKHGSALVDDEDVPEKFRTSYYPYNWEQEELFPEKKEAVDSAYDDLIHLRWDWVLNEMIFAFESIDSNWDEKYCTGEHDIQWQKNDDDTSTMVRGPNDTYTCDYVAMQKEQDRINNGFRLFGKYFNGLWD